MEKPMKTYSYYLLKLSDCPCAEGIAPSNGTLTIAMQSPQSPATSSMPCSRRLEILPQSSTGRLATIRKSSRGVLNRNSEHVRTPGAYGLKNCSKHGHRQWEPVGRQHGAGWREGRFLSAHLNPSSLLSDGILATDLVLDEGQSACS